MRKVLLLLLAFICAGCPKKKGTQYITFVNNSDREIACQQFWSGHITDADTLYQCRIPAYAIPANNLIEFESLNYCWEIDFKAIPFIQFLIMDEKIYSEYINPPDCDTIRKYVPILHCYRLTLEDLQHSNWTVVYPPEE